LRPCSAAYARGVFSFVPPGLLAFGLGEALVAEEGGADVPADWANPSGVWPRLAVRSCSAIQAEMTVSTARIVQPP
jgi:hypothetical protein